MLEKKLSDLKTELDASWQKLKLDDKILRAKELQKESEDPDLWRDPNKAKNTNEELSHLNDEISEWNLLKTQLNDIEEILSLNDEDLEEEIIIQFEALEAKLMALKKSLRFTGEHDEDGAILRITSGVGGTEAMDWASMLERMYLRFAEKNNYKVTCLERVSGEEAGIKTAVYEISGLYVYGTLKSEHGVHRLVRLSPFNADNLRQTSFALVEILPAIKNSEEVEINQNDLRIDVYHSGGHGGQSVNTTNSAVRITHIPTNTVVAIQNERSQRENKEKAMEILRGKLIQMKEEQHAESIGKLRAGESAKWGQQIRNYVFQPYKLVKDTRTKYETTNVEDVLNGNIMPFIDAYLENDSKS